MSAATVQANPQSPPIPQGFGVVIRAVPYPPRAGGELWLHGSFHLPRAVLDVVERPIQRAVVLVVQRIGEATVATPLREHILFDEDDQLSPGGVCGYFSLDVFESQGGGVPGEYHLFVSIDEHLSNVLAVDVAP